VSGERAAVEKKGGKVLLGKKICARKGNPSFTVGGEIPRRGETEEALRSRGFVKNERPEKSREKRWSKE